VGSSKILLRYIHNSRYIGGYHQEHGLSEESNIQRVYHRRKPKSAMLRFTIMLATCCKTSRSTVHKRHLALVLEQLSNMVVLTMSNAKTSVRFFKM